MINRRIIFSYKKDSLIQFAPYFSIERCPNDFPMPPAEHGHYPYFIDFKTDKVSGKKGILEYSYKLGEKPNIEEYQKFPIPDHVAQLDEAEEKLNEILYLVNSLCQENFFTYTTRQHWTVCLNDEHKMCYGQEGYVAPEYENEVEEIVLRRNYDSVDPILFTYKTNNSNERIVKLRDLLELYYYSTDDNLKKEYLNACVVLTKSFELLEVDWSASYILLVSTIEALIEIEHKNTKVSNCKACGQPVYKIRKKFHDFIEKYCYEIDKKTKDLFYGIRSGIAHSGQLLGMSYRHKWAIESQEDFDLKYKSSMDRIHYESLRNLVQMCLRTFLYINFQAGNPLDKSK